MSEPIQSIAQNNYILHNIDAKKLYVQEPLFTANSGDAVYVGWRPDETVLWSGYHKVSANSAFSLTEPPTNFEYIEIYGKGYPGRQTKMISRMWTEDLTQDYLNCTVDAAGGTAGAALRFNQFLFSANTTENVWVGSARQFSLQGSTASTATTPALINRIVGVNRISGGNS